MSHPRRRQWQLFVSGIALATVAVGLLLGGAWWLAQGVATPATGALTGAAAAGLLAGRRLRLSARHAVGADSERLVARALAALRADGWRVRHGVDWPGPGDIDHVVVGRRRRFAIETKTARYSAAHLERVSHQARWLGRRRQPGVPVLALCRGRGVQRIDGEVLVVTVDELVGALRRIDAAGQRAARRPVSAAVEEEQGRG